MFDAAVIGGGFKGMMTAYGLMQQGKSVCIIEKGKQLGGFMSPMNWRGVDIDKGPQYLDGINEAHKLILDNIMAEHEPLDSLEYSYGTFWNNRYTEGFALPDYRTLPKVDKAAVLYETLTQNSATEKPYTIADLYTDESEKSFSYIKRWCNKFLREDAENLSAINISFVTFFGRKLLLDNELSVNLKQHPLIDNVLAASKVSVDHGTHNLYPLNKNLGYFRRSFEDKLQKSGVTSYMESEVSSIALINDSYAIDLAASDAVTAREIYCAAPIEITEKILLQSSTIKQYTKPVAQLFYMLEIELNKELPFYIMNYSSSSISRITNFTAYGNKSSNGKSILCVEVPTTINSAEWNDPENHYAVLCDEINAMGLDANAIEAHQAFKVPATYRTVLRGYEQQLDIISQKILKIYDDKVHILTPHLLTRASIMEDLTRRGILN